MGQETCARVALSLVMPPLDYGNALLLGQPQFTLQRLQVAHTSAVKKKVKVQVHSLVSSAKDHSPDFTQLPNAHRTCSFIGHLNSPGSIQPGYHFRRMEPFKYTAFTVPPGTPLLQGRESARVSKVPHLGAQRQSILSAAGDRNRDRLPVRRARYH